MNLTPIIDGRLYQSGYISDTEALYKEIRPTVVIDCCEGLPLVGLQVNPLFIKIPFKDATLPYGEQGIRLVTRIGAVARAAAALIRDGEKILTHCAPNENRSSLVNGLILIELRRMGILTFKNVVNFIHNRRPDALQNQSFIRFLNGQSGILEVI